MTGLSVADRCLQASVFVGSWSAKRVDKLPASFVHSQKGMSEDAGEYIKHLVNTKHPLFRDIVKATSQFRKAHYSHTVAWPAFGVYILPPVLTGDYQREVGNFKIERDAAVKAYAEIFPQEIEARRQALGPYFDASQYPSAEELIARFRCSYSITPMPRLGTFPTDLLPEEIADLESEMADQVQASIQESMSKLGLKLCKSVRELAEACLSDRDRTIHSGGSAPGKKCAPRAQVFRDSKIENIQDLCAMLPKLDITGSGIFDSHVQDIQALVAGLTGKELRRVSGDQRRSIGKEADRCAKVLQGAFKPRAGKVPALTGIKAGEYDFGL